MKRRHLLQAAASGLAMPAVARAQAGRTLRFIPQADLSILDPHLNTAYVTRNHGFMVFDTLYGQNGRYQVSGQMVAGHTVGGDGKRWTLLLRDGLRWHDGEPVLARDCVASIRRWGAKDVFGQSLLAATDELSAPDDRTILFRLKHPFPLLPDALAKSGVYMPAMMPERLARTDPTVAVTEIVGSGPFVWQADERVPGARAVWRRNEAYAPVPTGTPDFLAGPKVVHLDRVVWTTTPDPATAAAALQAGETDWWEYAAADLLPLLRRNTKLTARVQDPAGQAGLLRMNHLQPPFDNPAIRRVVLRAVVQADYMTAMLGDDRTLWRDGQGVFTGGTPLANDAGLAVLTGPRDRDALKRDLDAAGYNLRFPFNLRPLLAGWNALYLRGGPPARDPARSAAWNRGAYLVDGLGHCAACHSPRNAFGAERGGTAYLAGGAVRGWDAQALDGSSRAPLPWTEDDFYAYLRDGFAPNHGPAGGPMAAVVQGLQGAPDADLRAMAVYLASLAPAPGAGPTAAELEARTAPGPATSLGARLYQGACAACHAAGRAPFGIRPSLALNSNVHADTPDTLIRVVLDGAGTMPGFATSFDDGQVAALLRFVRAQFAPGRPDWDGLEAAVARVRAGSP